MTQEELANRAGVHRVYLAQIETGVKTPSPLTLTKLAKALKVRVEALGLEDAKVVTVKLTNGKELEYRNVTRVESKPHRLQLFGGEGGLEPLAEFDKADISSWYSQ